MNSHAKVNTNVDRLEASIHTHLPLCEPVTGLYSWYWKPRLELYFS
jgi:hypothetical protein